MTHTSRNAGRFVCPFQPPGDFTAWRCEHCRYFYVQKDVGAARCQQQKETENRVAWAAAFYQSHSTQASDPLHQFHPKKRRTRSDAGRSTQ